VLDRTSTIESFLEAAAAKQATPGGGSVAALAGALAASMGEMVLNYSIGKKGLEEYSDAMKFLLEELKITRLILLGLMASDQKAYESLMAARKNAKSGDGQEELLAAIKECVNVPKRIANAAVAILQLSDEIVDWVNPYLLSDLAVCGDLAMATVRCAVYNVRINLPEIADEKLRWEIETATAQLLSRATLLIQHLSPAIWTRVAKMQKS
jgi:formiminotetrahydrofolate cyclodeaminase